MRSEILMRIPSIILLLLLPGILPAQDTLRLSLAQADSIFLVQNLNQLAARYKIDAQKAQVQQSKLWNNPQLTTEWNLYNPSKNRYFDAGANGQKIIGIEQVVSIAGKRNKRIALAKENVTLSELEFYEMMRTLKTALHSTYYEIYFTTFTLNKYNTQLGFLGNIIDALQLQHEKGNITLKEVLRLKALYYQLNNERTTIVSNLQDARKELSVMLQLPQVIQPTPLISELNKYNLGQLDLKTLQDKALNNRPDLKMAENNLNQAALNLSLEKRNAYPDLHIGGVYDQAGSYVNNYTGITLGFDLPVLNRNQGNIRMAKAIEKQYTATLQQKASEVQYEVAATYQKLLQVEQEYQKVDVDFDKKFDALNEGYLINFQRRNITLMEFTDFLEAYNNSIQQINQMKENRIKTYEELNYVIGEELFK